MRWKTDIYFCVYELSWKCFRIKYKANLLSLFLSLILGSLVQLDNLCLVPRFVEQCYQKEKIHAKTENLLNDNLELQINLTERKKLVTIGYATANLALNKKGTYRIQ